MSNTITDAQALEAEGNLNEAIQAYDSILNTTDEGPILALVNFRLGTIYRTWGGTLHGTTVFIKSTSTLPKRRGYPRGD